MDAPHLELFNARQAAIERRAGRLVAGEDYSESEEEESEEDEDREEECEKEKEKEK